MFLDTFDNLKSYNGIEPNQRFFKSEDEEDKNQSKFIGQFSEVRRYYESYGKKSTNVGSLQFGGLFENESIVF
jgi:hypothetical protein